MRLIVDRTARPINVYFNLNLECKLNIMRGSFIAKDISEAGRLVLNARVWQSSTTNVIC